jgi:hypothetical protein
MKNNMQDGLYAAFDLGSASLKASVIEITDSRPRLAVIEEDSLKQITDFPDEQEYRVHLIESLQNISSRIPLKECRKISVLFSHREMQVKVIELPGQIEGDQIEKVLTWEAKKLLAPTFRDEPYAFTYKIIKQSPYTIALAVIPQRLLEKHIELFEDAGITVNNAFAEVFAAHSLKDSIDNTGLPALSIVNFGNSGTHLQIFSTGDLRFYRYIPSGLSELSDPPKDNELEMYSQKIRFSFDYFRAVSKLSQIDAVFFMGGGAAHPEILPYQRNYFNPTRVNIVDISATIDISPILPDISENAPAEEKQRKLLPFLPSVGAILTMFSSDSHLTDFAQRLNKSKREKRIKELSKSMPLVFSALGLIIIAVVLFFMHSNYQNRLVEINKNLEMKKIDVKAINIKIAKYKAARNLGGKISPAAKKALASVFAKQRSGADVLFAVSKGLQKGLSVTDIIIRNNSEAENISLDNLHEQASFNMSGQDNEETNPFLSKLSNDTGDYNRFNEGLGGKILILYGTTDNNEGLAQFAEFLAEKKVIKRINSLQSKKQNSGEFEFLLKGEMP